MPFGIMVALELFVRRFASSAEHVMAEARKVMSYEP
jgi:hypothetical protein